MEARAIKAKQAGTAGLLYDHGSDRDKVRLKGGRPKDHASENVRKMRMQAKDRKETVALKEAKELEKKSFKLSQFKDVQSRATAEAELKGNAKEEKHEYRKAGTGRNCAGSHNIPLEEAVHVPKIKSKPRVPSKQETLSQPAPTRPQHNFVNKNFTQAVKNETPNRQAVPARKKSLPGGGHARGEVPNYLKNRKEALEKERRDAMDRYDPACPDGMIAMPDDERVGALDLLQQNKCELTKQLGKLSFARSHKTDRQQNEIYEKLNEIDAAIDVFSKPKVYVSA